MEWFKNQISQASLNKLPVYIFENEYFYFKTKVNRIIGFIFLCFCTLFVLLICDHLMIKMLLHKYNVKYLWNIK